LFIRPVLASTAAPEARGGSSEPDKRALSERYARRPIAFEPNRGQVAGSSVRFLARGAGLQLLLTEREAIVGVSARRAKRLPFDPSAGLRSALDERADEKAEPLDASRDQVITIRFLAASPSPSITAEGPLPGAVNDYAGADPAQWQTGVPTFERVRYTDLYPGIDAVFYGNARELEYDFIVKPGASPSSVRLAFEGAERIELAPTGHLLLHTAAGALTQRAPVIYQETDGVRHPIDGGYRVDGNRVGFWVDEYDHAHTLVIDPTLDASRMLGGSGGDVFNGVSVASNGSVWAVGGTTMDFPGATGSGNGTLDIVAVQFNPALDTVLSTTVIRGTGDDEARDVVTSGIFVYVAANTTSINLPVPGAAAQPTFGGLQDGYLVRLSPTGTVLNATYVGGTGIDGAFGSASSASGNVYVTGHSASPGLATGGAFKTTPGGTDMFWARYDATLSTKFALTYYGDSGIQAGTGIGVDGGGNVYVAGSTDRGGTGQFDAFVARFTPSGSALIWERLFGGSGNESGTGLAVSSIGPLYLTGTIESTNVTLPLLVSPEAPLDRDVYVLSFHPDGTTRFGVRVPTRGNEFDPRVSLGPDGTQVALTFTTDATNVPMMGAFQDRLGSTGIHVVTNLAGTPVVTEIGRVLLPINDGDVSDLQGARFFDDVAALSSANALGVRHLITVTGESNDFLNTVWNTGSSIQVPATARGMALVPPDQPATGTGANLVVSQVKGGMLFFENLNDGTGAFQPPTTLPGSEGFSYSRVVIANNPWGFTPVALGANTGQVFTFVPDGSGGFLAPHIISFAGVGTDIATGDTNMDSLPDLIVGAGAPGSPRVAVYTNTGNPSNPYQAPISIPLSGQPTGINLADLDNDGVPDIVATVDNQLVGFRNEGGTFGGGEFVIGPGTARPAAGDINDDGLVDLIVPASNGLGPFVYVNRTPIGGAPAFSRRSVDLGTGGPARIVVIDDVDHDGARDIITFGGRPSAPVVMLFGVSSTTPILMGSSYLDGPGNDRAASIAYAGQGNVFVVGAAARGFPSTIVSDFGGGQTDAFVAGIDLTTPPGPNAPPVVTAQLAAATVNEGDTASVSGTTSDPDLFDTISLVIDWGDGTAPSTLSRSGAATPFSAPHVYAEDGVLTIDLTATDNDGASGATSLTVTVTNVAATVVGPPALTVPENVSVTLTATFSDSGTLDTHTGTIDWGDGIVTAGTISESGGSGSITGSHVYPTAGTYNVTFTVTDDDGASGSGTTTVTVAPAGRLSATMTDALVNDTDGDGLAGPGDTLRYRVVIGHVSGSAVHNVQLSVADLEGFNGTVLVPGSETTSQGTIVTQPPNQTDRVDVNIGTIEPGGVVTIEFDAVIQPGFIEAVASQGLVDSDAVLIVTDDPDTEAPNDATVTRMEPPRLKASKTAIFTVDADADGVIGPGDTLSYEVTIRHLGGMAAHEVEFSDRGEFGFNGSGLVVGTVTTTQGVVRVGNTGEFTKDTGVEVGVGFMYTGEEVVIRFDTVVDPTFNLASNQGLVTSDELQVQVVTDDPDTATEDDATLTLFDAPANVRFVDRLGRSHTIVPYEPSRLDAARIVARQAEYLVAQRLCRAGIRFACALAEWALRAIDRLVPQDVRYRAAVSNPPADSLPATLLNVDSNGNVATTFNLTMTSDGAGRAYSESIIAVRSGVPIVPGVYGRNVLVPALESGVVDVIVPSYGPGQAGVCGPIPLAEIRPPGARIYDPPVPGELTSSNETNCLAIKVDEGQTITVRIDATTPELQPRVTLLGTDGLPLGAAIAPAAGGSALLQTLPALARGTYRLEIGGAQNTLGTYTAQVALNAAFETETDLAPNNSIATAQSLEGSFLYMFGTASHAAVLGTTEAGTPDYYSFELAAGDTITLALAGLSPGEVDLSLFDATGAVLATSSSALNADKYIANFTPTARGTYFVGVSAAPDVPYSLVAARNAAFDIELSDTAPTVVPLGTNLAAFAWVGGSDAQDVYSLTATAGQLIEFVTTTPADGPGQFVNALNPGLTLLDETGQTVAVGTPLADGRNERLIFTPSMPGTYRIAVSWQPRANGATSGPYQIHDRGAVRRRQ
jgi:hypothetical protein